MQTQAELIAAFLVDAHTGHSEATRKAYKFYLRHWERWAIASSLSGQVTPEKWQRFWRAITASFRSPTTWHLAASAHRAFWRWAAQTNGCNPCVINFLPKPSPVPRKPLGESQLQLLLKPTWPVAAHALKIDAVLAMLIWTGARIGELAKAQVPDWEAATRTLAVRSIKSGGTGMLHLNPVASARLAAWLKVRRLCGAQNIFVTANGKPYNNNSLGFLVIDHCKRRGVVASPHLFRHTFATRLLERGVALHVVQMLLNHKSPNSTLHYAHASPLAIEEALQSLKLSACVPSKISTISRTKRPAMSDGTKASINDLPHTPKGAVCGLPGCPPSTDAPVFYNAPVSNWS